jgi:GxxExxY protein
MRGNSRVNQREDQKGREGTEDIKGEPSSELDQLAHRVIGAAIEVHRLLGPGFLESVYQSALEVELRLRAVEFQAQCPIGVRYKGHNVGEARIDLLVAGRLIVELKAVDKLLAIHEAQTISYLKATGYQLALLINFNEDVLRQGLKRIVFSRNSRRASDSAAPQQTDL